MRPPIAFILPLPQVLALQHSPWGATSFISNSCLQVTLRTVGRSEEKLFRNTNLQRDQCVLTMRMSFPL